MRKFLGVAGVLLAMVFSGCETKTPVGPSGNTPTTSTTTSTVPATAAPTTSSSTTTTIVLGGLARRYQAFQPPPNVPMDLTLFFELIQTGSAATAGDDSAPSLTARSVRTSLTENEYQVTGVYVMGNGTSGTISGELGGSSNPLETGGEFEGALTATTPSGCTAQREFSGPLTTQTLQWTGGSPGTSSCSPSPLAFNSFSMLKSDPAAPLPTTTVAPTPPTPPPPPPTTVCSYTVSPTNQPVSSAGGEQQVTVSSGAGCAWSAQSFADWLVVQPPYGSSGNGTVRYVVQPGTTARSGTLLIAGTQVTVTQSAPVPPVILFADLLAESPNGGTPQAFCRIVQTTSGRALRVNIRNAGQADAGRSDARVTFTSQYLRTPADVDRPTPAIPLAGNIPVSVDFPIPPQSDGGDSRVCADESSGSCTFVITVDVNRAVAEGPSGELNNGRDGGCFFSQVGLRTGTR